MLIDATSHKVLTMREYPLMTLIEPRIDRTRNELIISIKGSEIGSVPLEPTAEQCAQWPILSNLTMWKQSHLDGYDLSKAYPSLHTALSQHLGIQCKLLHKGPSIRESGFGSPPPLLMNGETCQVSYADGYPMLLASEESFKDVNSRLEPAFLPDSSFVLERFRANVVVGGGLRPFQEDEWREITIGNRDNKTFYVINRCTRCRLPNVDPNSGIADKDQPFKILQSYRRVDKGAKYEPCFGMNISASFVKDGEIKVGDIVKIVKTGYHERKLRYPTEN